MSVNTAIYATNMYGTSIPSLPSSGANITILVPPKAPETPVSANVESNITISWKEPPTVTPILNYTILIKCADGTWAAT
jgi:hypothetical protein